MLEFLFTLKLHSIFLVWKNIYNVNILKGLFVFLLHNVYIHTKKGNVESSTDLNRLNNSGNGIKIIDF